MMKPRFVESVKISPRQTFAPLGNTLSPMHTCSTRIYAFYLPL